MQYDSFTTAIHFLLQLALTFEPHLVDSLFEEKYNNIISGS